MKRATESRHWNLTSDKNTGLGHIDILLTDVKMPFMDGIELIKNVVQNNLSLKTVIFSGYNEFEYAKLAVKLGVKDYILKPVDPAEFSSTITGVINELDEEHKKDEDYNRLISESSTICIRCLTQVMHQEY